MKLIAMWLFVVLLGVVYTSDSNSSTNICVLKKQPGFELNLVASMLFTKYLLLIDSNYLVYEVPREGINTYGRLVLNISGVPIEDYWPAFKDDKRWQILKSHYKSIYHMFDPDGSEYVYIDAFPCPFHHKDDGPQCIRYNMHKKEMEWGWNGYPSPAHEQVIMDDHMKRVYTIKDQGKDPPRIYIWDLHSTKDGGGATHVGRLYYLVNETDESDRNVTVLYSGNIYTAKHNPLLNDPRFKGYRLENLAADWDIATRQHLPLGFLFKGQFNLYTFKKVMFFADALPPFKEAYANKDVYKPGTVMLNTKVTFVPVSEYIQCAHDASHVSLATWPPTEAFHAITFKPTSSLNLLLIIGLVVLAILVGIACFVYFSCLSEKARKRRRHHKKGKNSKEKLSKGSSNRTVAKASSSAGKQSHRDQLSAKQSMRSVTISKQSQMKLSQKE